MLFIYSFYVFTVLLLRDYALTNYLCWKSLKNQFGVRLPFNHKLQENVMDMPWFTVKILIIKGKPFLVVIGGNTGTTPVNDVWVLNIEKIPY